MIGAKFSRIFISLLCSSLGSFANAEKLALADIVRMGMKRSPLVKKAAADLNDAIATTAQYRGALFPNVYLDLSTQSNRNSQTFSNLSTGSNAGAYTQTNKAYLAATQPLFQSGGLTAGIEQRHVSEDIAVLAKLTADQTLVSNIVLAYYGYAQQNRLFLAAKDNFEILESYNKIINRFERIGRARTTDKLLSEINLVSARAIVNNLDSQVSSQKEQLRQLLAVDELPEIDLEGDSTLTKIDKISPSEAVAIALNANPDLLAAKKQINLIQSSKDVDVSQDLPNLSLSGQLGFQSPDQPHLFDSSSQFGQVMLEFKAPLFSGLSSIYKRRSYEEKKVSASRNAELIQLSLEANLRSQLKELESSFDRLQLTREAALKARNALEIGNRDFQRSLISPQDILTLQTSRYNAEQTFINTLFGYLNTLLKTRSLMGINLEASYAKK